MQISPLVIHAGIQIPRHTSRFSDALAVASMVVTEGGNVVLTCSTPHGVRVGDSVAISITDADIPNAITAADVVDGDILITTATEHDLSTSPDPDRFRAFHETAKVSGFTSADINGNRQLVSAPTSTTLVIAPGAPIGSIALTGNEKLLERLDGEVVGWHAAVAISSTVLRFPTPSAVERTYTVLTPTVVKDIRVYAAVTIEQALAHFTPEDGTELTSAHMFILPLSSVRTSRGRGSQTDAIAEISPGVDFRQLMLDGFTVLAFIPGATTAAHVRAVDLCNGEVLKAVLRSFLGLKIPRPELAADGTYTAILESHAGGITDNRAIYVHRYDFQCPAYLTNADAISPTDWPALDPTVIATQADDVAAGGTLDGDAASVGTIGTYAFRGIDFTGLLHYGHPRPLTASV